MKRQYRSVWLAAAMVALSVTTSHAQEPTLEEGLRVARLRAEPAQVTVEAGKTAPLRVIALDAQGRPVNAAVRVTAGRGTVRIGYGQAFTVESVTGLRAGEFEVSAAVMLPGDASVEPVTLTIPVTVTWPRVTRIELESTGGMLYEKTTLGHRAAAYHADGTKRPEASFEWSSSDPAVATVDRFGNVTAHKTGTVTIAAELDGARATKRYTVAPFTATRLELTGGGEQARTGDVLTFTARAVGNDGRALADLPVTWTYTFVPDDSIHAPNNAGQIRDGKFVGSVPGRYTVIAMAGPLSARKAIDVRPRGVVQRVEIVGQGTVDNVHTSDLWVWQGLDGRDYAVTGTWGGDGYAYFWDVTDPGNIVKTDSIKIDARTVNDVKVSPDGRYAALSREGASNRRNGVVILDLADPAHPTIASVYDDGLTGGVHNMFATDDYLFALSAGDKYVILDVRDIKNPTYVSEYDHPDSRLHDVWVHNGIAYSSEWQTGVVVVDVGNGRWGGTIENPKFVTNIPYPVGANHAAFPYFQESTGKFYLFLGDEIMARDGKAWAGAGLARIPEKGGTPSVTSGYIHIIDFTDPENPKDVARYEVPEYGTHNLWVEDDKLYVAYYEGGLRVVDVSGELMGNLYEQGREIAAFKAFDPNGYVNNAPMAWGPQPYKGHIFFSDFNSGLWSVKLEPPKRRPAT